MPAALPLGTRIKRARERLHMTQSQLASAVGVNVKSVDNWEAGRTTPRNRLGALEEVLGISLGEEPAAAPGPLDDLLPVQEDWETGVLEDPHLPVETKRWLIEESRAARARSAARRNGGQATAPAS